MENGYLNKMSRVRRVEQKQKSYEGKKKSKRFNGKRDYNRYDKSWKKF